MRRAWGGLVMLAGVAAGAAEQFATSPEDLDAVTYLWVVSFSLWGSCAAYLQTTIDKPNSFSWRVLLIEWTLAPIAGLSVFWLAEAAHIGRLYAAVAVFGAGLGSKEIIGRLVERATRITD